MASLFRPLFVLVLCGMLAVGHAPAWFHLATCTDACALHTECGPSHFHPGDLALAHFGCHPGCHHDLGSHAPASTPHEHSPEEPSPEQEPRRDHHPDGCVVCQSLAIAAAITWVTPAKVGVEPTREQIVFRTELLVCETIITISQPRAPPSIA
ncbi:hypothetical protein [Blastopirellula marina]|uniref:hypothetical protein n=1 Tax=Blastopirellula marina TaxID=124 RepID=UPI0011B06D7A|nr:hypothetical protein [Blastopirellula marina]